MSKQLPPLNWFRAFEASARRLSFTAAAEELGMTQSAVSQQIRALETRFCVPLFDRQSRGLSLTDHGRTLLPQVETALETLSAATARFDPMQRSADLIVSASISMSEWVISPALRSFRAQHPGVAIRLLTAIWPDEFAAMRADVAVRFGSQKQVGKDAEPVQPNDLVALHAPGLKGNLAALPLIEAVGTSQGWSAWGDAAGIDGLRPHLYVDSYGLALRLAADGNGVALASSVLAGPALRDGRLVLGHRARITGKEGYFLSVNRGNETAIRFRDWLMATISRTTLRS